jgi:hypothetical protein
MTPYSLGGGYPLTFLRILLTPSSGLKYSKPSLIGLELIRIEIWKMKSTLHSWVHTLKQCLSTAGPRPGTGPWHQLYRTLVLQKKEFTRPRFDTLRTTALKEALHLGRRAGYLRRERRNVVMRVVQEISVSLLTLEAGRCYCFTVPDYRLIRTTPINTD